MVSTRTLGKIAVVGGFFVCGSGLLIQRHIRRNFCRQDFYKQSLGVLDNYTMGAELLGKPIEVLKVDLADVANNWTDGIKAKVAIPLKGVQRSGVLYTWSSRTTDDRWRVEKADLEVQNKQWTFYIHPEARDRFQPTNQMNTEPSAANRNNTDTTNQDNQLLYLDTKS